MAPPRHPQDGNRRALISVTLISSPYHVGLRASPVHRSRVSEGPGYVLASAPGGGLRGLLRASYPGLPVREVEIPPVADEFEGDVGRSFEIIRRVSREVAAARRAGSFPVVLAGNCCVSVGVAAGLCAAWEGPEEREEEAGKGEAGGNGGGRDGGELGCVWFDAHDDYNVPDTVLSGYFDSQGIAMMAGECWRALLATVPGFRPVRLRRVVHCGMRDVNELERARVLASEMGVVWGGDSGSGSSGGGGDGSENDEAAAGVEFEGGLRRELRERFSDGVGKGEGDGDGAAVLVHLDVDVLDASLGKANQFACPGGMFEEDLLRCMEAITEETIPLAFTIASFDPLCDGDESARTLAGAAVKAVDKVLSGLKSRGLLG